ncbi:hypothetical protein BV25DRAFT_1788311, partial [Artomyces pyxidatus]
YTLVIRWVAGHADVEGNELADAGAKEAAAGLTSNTDDLPAYLRNRPLPISVSALRQVHHAALLDTWKDQWRKSPRFSRLNGIDPALPGKSFMKLV